MLRNLLRPIYVMALTVLAFPLAVSADEQTEVSPPQPETPQSYQLAYKFEPGQVVRFYSEFRAKMAIRFKEASEVDQNSTTLWKHYRVIDVAEDGSGTLELQLDKVHQTAQFADHPPTVFKSDDEDFHPPKFRDTLKQIGKPTARVDYSPQGKLLRVVAQTGEQKVAKGNQVPKDHQGFLIPLPKDPIAVGGTWKDKFQQVVKTQAGLNQIIEMMRVYELKSVQAGLARIEFRTAILTPVNDGYIRGKLIQKQTAGSMTFDIERGIIVKKLVRVDRTVVGPFGPGSSIHAVTKFEEKLIPHDVVAENNAKTSARN